MSFWNHIHKKFTKDASTPKIPVPPNFDYKAGYERLVPQFDTASKALIIAVEALMNARDMSVMLVEQAKKLEVGIEHIGGVQDGKQEAAYLIKQDAIDGFVISAHTYVMTIEHIRKSMSAAATAEIEARIESEHTSPTEKRLLKLMLERSRQDAGVRA